MSHLFYICIWSYIVWRFGKLGFLVSYSEAQSSEVPEFRNRQLRLTYDH